MHHVHRTCYVLLFLPNSTGYSKCCLQHNSKPQNTICNILQFWHTNCPHAHNFSNTNSTQTKRCLYKDQYFFCLCWQTSRTYEVLPHAHYLKLLHDTFRFVSTVFIFHFLWFCCCCCCNRQRERERCLSAYNLYCGIENMAAHTPLRITI